MKICRNCHVTILDSTLVCPLCHSVLEAEKAPDLEGVQKSGSNRDSEGVQKSGANSDSEIEHMFGCETEQKEERPGMYPDVKAAVRKLNFVVQLYTFLAIVVEAGLIVINYMTFRHIWWSAISGIAILYFYITLRYSIQKNSGYLRIILTQIICAVLLSVVVDWIVGYRGWSVNFVVPSAILLIDLAVIILMIVNQANWQSYILLQLLTVICSIVTLILWKTGIIVYPVVAFVAAAVSFVLFVGTLIFGDRRAKNELKRRFHV